MIKKHELYEDSSFTNEMMISFTACVTEALNAVSTTLSALKDYKEGSMDGEELLEIFESSMISDMTIFEAFARTNSSRIMAINRAMKQLISRSITGIDVTSEKETKIDYRGDLDIYNDKLVSFVKYGAEPTGAELDNFIVFVSRLTGRLAYVLAYEFDLAAYLSQLEAGIEEIDIVIEQYCGRYRKNTKEYAEMVIAALAYNRPQIAVFDEYPDLEQPFLDIVGPYSVDIDEDAITIDIVTKVIKGTILPSELYDIFHSEV